MDVPHLKISTPQGMRDLPVGKKPLTVGRNAQNVLVITDDSASRFHCVIEQVPEGFRLRDLDSRNGTKLNGKPVKAALLLDGDVVTIGRTHMKMVLPAGSVPAQPVPPTKSPKGATVPPPKPGSQRPTFAQKPAKAPAKAAARSNDSGIPIASDDDYDVSGDDPSPHEIDESDESSAGDETPLESLRDLAESLPEKPFRDSEISLLNARGQVRHPARSGQQAAKNAAPESEALVMLRLLLLVCFRTHATDVHIEPKNEDAAIRIRCDGNMVDVVRITRELGTKLSAVVKVLSDVDIAQKNIIQEGHFTAMVPGSPENPRAGTRRVDYRVSFAPAMFGQKLVIRVLDTANTPLRVKDLALPDWMQDALSRAIEQESGMVLVCGPTGSGKTTSLYAAVRDIDVEQRNVVTIEDPVEIQIEGVTQIPVNEGQGNTFAALLRSVLRQDPDAILVGEIRDAETARIAMQSAMTGHLVFSTVHARDTIGTIFRLLDLGIEPYLVASGLQLMLAQRLIRKLCPFCKQPVTPSAHQLEKMGPAHKDVGRIFTSKGCARCLGTGHAGRRAIYEMLQVTQDVRDIVLTKPNMQDILKVLGGTKFQRLQQSGYDMVAEGAASFEEIDRAVG